MRVLAVALAFALPIVAFSCAKGSSPLASGGGDGPLLGNAGTGGSGGVTGQGGQGGTSGGSGGRDGGLISELDGAFDDVDGGSLPDVTPADAAADAVPDVFVDVDGPPTRLLLNAVSNVPEARFCLVRWAGGVADDSSVPQPAAPLPFGQHLDPVLPAGFDPEGDSLRPYLVTGEVGGATCAALIAAPPAGVLVQGLAVVPPPTFARPRSLALVMAGCAQQPPAADVYGTCGNGVDTKVGNLTMILAEMARTPPPAGQVGLQVLAASTASSSVALRLTPTDTNTPVSLIAGLSVGGIGPRPPLSDTIDTLFGIKPGTASLGLKDGQTGADLFSVAVGESLATSGLDVSALVPGKNFVLVVAGPRSNPPPLEAGVAPTPRIVWLETPALPLSP